MNKIMLSPNNIISNFPLRSEFKPCFCQVLSILSDNKRKYQSCTVKELILLFPSSDLIDCASFYPFILLFILVV